MNNEISIIRELHVANSDQKIEWFGYGEWVEEIDILEFDYKNYKCFIKRMIFEEQNKEIVGGYLCGYIMIPKNHELYGNESFDINIDCHGGITFNEFDNQHHLIGFDCEHSHDFQPWYEKFKKTNNDMIQFRKEMQERFGEFLKESLLFNPTYKNVNFCVEECKSIVDQLIEMNSQKVM